MGRSTSHGPKMKHNARCSFLAAYLGHYRVTLSVASPQFAEVSILHYPDQILQYKNNKILLNVSKGPELPWDNHNMWHFMNYGCFDVVS